MVDACPAQASSTPKAREEGEELLEEDDPGRAKWKAGDRVYAVWAGNGCYYAATVETVDSVEHVVTVLWDDKADSHRTVSFDQVVGPAEDTQGWSTARIDRRASVRDSPEKGRCLFTNEAAEPGQVVFVEKPTVVALPAAQPKLWKHLQNLHEAQPLVLGTVSFHFAALLSLKTLDEKGLAIILDKFVPDADEDPGEDVVRILKSLQEVNKEHPEDCMADFFDKPVDARQLQKLVSAWRYNSFGHHTEDGLVLYNRISMCAHSCDPACCWSYGEEDAFVLRARIALDKDAELTISYLQDDDLLRGTMVRQQKLQNWRFTCLCTRCNLRVDVGRGFKCRRCRVGVSYANSGGTLEMCHVCTTAASQESTKMLLQLEQEYVARVDGLDKTDVSDVLAVYQAAIEIFERHWMIYAMDTMLWESLRETNLSDAIEHQRRRIEFHEHYYHRPTFILAWCHEELGDSVQTQVPGRKWYLMHEYERAYQMLVILCGSEHQYTTSPYNKLCQLNSGSGSVVAAGTETTAVGGG